MTIHAPELEIVAGVAGLLLGALIVFLAPRLAVHRLEVPPLLTPVIVLIPLLGTAISKWRPIQSIGVQMGMAAVFVALAEFYGDSRKLLLACLYTTILVTIAYVDIDYRLVLNRLSYPGIVIALAGAAVWPGFGLLNAFLGALVGLVFMGAFQLIGRGALGSGDTKLAILIGAMRGLPTVLSALFLGILLGGLAAAFLWFVLRRGRKEFFAYAPYLSAGAILSLFVSGP